MKKLFLFFKKKSEKINTFKKIKKVDCPEIQPYSESCLNLVHTAHIVAIYSSALVFFQNPMCLGLLVFCRFLTFDRLMQLPVFVLLVSPIPIHRHLGKWPGRWRVLRTFIDTTDVEDSRWGPPLVD